MEVVDEVVLSIGESAPDVEAYNQWNEKVIVNYEQPTVLYFYPEDHTPGCQTEARQFELEGETYRDAGVEVYGISVDSPQSHCEFAESNEITFDLLSDPEGQVAQAFDVPMNNDRFARTTVVVVEGQVQSVYEDVDPDGHAREVLMDLLDEGVVRLED